MAKTDWKSIKKQYVKEVGETGVDLKTFCIRNGLSYSTARKYLTIKLLEDNGITKTGKGIVRTKRANSSEQNNEKSSETVENSIPNDSHATSTTETHEKARDQSSGEEKKNSHGGKREGAGAPKGNKNAYVHGLMSKAFGDLVKYSHQVDDDFKLEVHKLASLQALESYGKYKDELEALKSEIAKTLLEGKPPTELQLDELHSLDKKMTYCLQQTTYHTGKLEYLENQMANRKYTGHATTKVKKQAEHIAIDMKLKSKSIGLADAKTDQAKAQTALARHELTAKEREGLGDKDDLGLLLDEVMELDNDEIVQRFKESGGELHIDD